jgi:hypothetical protein
MGEWLKDESIKLKFGKVAVIYFITSSISIVTANLPIQEKIPPPKFK